MTPLALIFTLAAIGISETIYLIRTRQHAELPVCPIGEGCAEVLTSKWSKIFIIPNDILGFLTYIAIATLSALVFIEVPEVDTFELLLKILITIGVLASLFFTYIQKFILKKWCFWCLMSACTTWLMGIIILFSNLN